MSNRQSEAPVSSRALSCTRSSARISSTGTIIPAGTLRNYVGGRTPAESIQPPTCEGFLLFRRNVDQEWRRYSLGPDFLVYLLWIRTGGDHIAAFQNHPFAGVLRIRLRSPTHLGPALLPR